MLARPLRLLFLLLALAPAAGATPAMTRAPREELSLEELLEAYRAEEERVLEAYRGEVEEIVRGIEGAYRSGKPKRLGELRGALEKLGDPVAPLLVGLIDPGPSADEAQTGRARQVTRVLEELSTRAVTTELLALLDSGSPEGRANALAVLSRSSDVERVGPVLRARFQAAPEAERGPLLAALALLGGPAQEEFLTAVLGDADPEVVGLALGALTEARLASAAPRVLALLADPARAARHARLIVAYYRALPGVVDDDHCAAMLGLVEALTSNPDEAVALLGLLTRHSDEWGSKLKRRIKELSTNSTPRVAQAALIALARDGDRAAKKKLLEPLDERLEENDLLATTWQSRADIRYQIGDYRGAIKDYAQALKVSETFGRQLPEAYVGIARCHALLGKEKDAAEWLEKAPISISKLRALAEDPDFAELVASERYRKVFHLKEGS